MMTDVSQEVAVVGGRAYRRTRLVLVIIGIFHVVLGVSAGFLLYVLNFADPGSEGDFLTLDIIANAALCGFIGSLLYFSRKVYAYLITDKFGRVIQEQGLKGEGTGLAAMDVETFKTVMIGYYVYLTTRPLAGLVIGPVLTMCILGGLATFGEAKTGGALELSVAGVYLIYVAAFIGGYSTSDLLDYFSKLGERLIKRIEIP